jgi:hypothetical protein
MTNAQSQTQGTSSNSSNAEISNQGETSQEPTQSATVAPAHNIASGGGPTLAPRTDGVVATPQGQTSVQEYLDGIVNDCRRGRTTKADGARKILDALDRITALPAPARDKAFESYLFELHTVGRKDNAPTLGTPHGPTVTPTETEAIRDTSEPVPQEDSLRDNLVQLLTKRGAASDDLDDAFSAHPKRQRYTQADMPWHGLHSGRKSINVELSYTRTCELLEHYGEDLPRSKFLVRTAPNAPEGVQSAQWERILKGEPLNLDHFLSSICRTTIDEDRQARLGATQLTFSTSEAKRKIKTYRDWISAWKKASRAIAFAFPHRADELDDYFLHIQTEFDSKQIGAHQRIILYDIAVRNYIGGGQSVLLVERERFSHLYSAIILTDGIEFPSNTGGKKAVSTPANGRSEVCNKFNTPSGCTYNPCKYRHSCKACGKDGHARPDCPNERKQ